MRYRRLGRSGLQVSEVSLGSWLTFGSSVDRKATREIVHRAYDLGINLFDTADAYAKGEGGADEPTWHTWKTGLRARIQPARIQVKDQHERRVTTAGFKVFLADDVPVDHTHRIRGPDGTVYRVVGYRKADRIDALVEVDVVRVN